MNLSPNNTRVLKTDVAPTSYFKTLGSVICDRIRWCHKFGFHGTWQHWALRWKTSWLSEWRDDGRFCSLVCFVIVLKPQASRFHPGLANCVYRRMIANNLGSWCEDEHKRTWRRLHATKLLWTVRQWRQLFFSPAALLSTFIIAFLLSSSVSLSYFNLIILILKCLGEQILREFPIFYSHTKLNLFFLK